MCVCIAVFSQLEPLPERSSGRNGVVGGELKAVGLPLPPEREQGCLAGWLGLVYHLPFGQ